MKGIQSYVKILIPLITFLMLQMPNVNAQVVVDFEMDNPEGCPTLVVQFTNLTTGDEDTATYEWDFGNGAPISNEEHPVATYTLPDTFTVTLTVVNGPSISKQVIVHTAPVADFSVADESGCVPFDAVFTDESTPGSGTIVGWSWDFRDGATSDTTNPIHRYNTAGTFDVFLEVTDNNGCKGSTFKPNFLDLVNPPVADFTPNPEVACQVPATISFTNQSTGSGILTYAWDFGDGNNSSSRNTSNNYTTFGVYDVEMIINSSYGCSDTINKLLNVNNIEATATLFTQGSEISSGDTICPGPVNFNSTVPGTPVLWKFGDGETSNVDSAIHVYNFSSTYNIVMIAAPTTVCADTQTWQFTVRDVSAEFEMSEVSTCKSPIDIDFTDETIDAVAWNWDFGDETSSTQQNPTHTFIVPADDDIYSLGEEYTFNIILTITNSDGCNATAQNSLKIRKPTARFDIDTSFGCAPLHVRFDDFTLSDDIITGFKWLYGDGATDSTTIDTTSHTYNTPGTYFAKVVITNEKECTDTSYPVVINVGQEIIPDFNLSSTNVCPNEVITITDNSPLSDSIDYWYYSVEGNLINDDITQGDFVWRVNSATGANDVSLEVDINGCKSETIKTDELFNNGPIANFSTSFSCSSPLGYSFTNASSGATSYNWTIGPYSSTQTDTNVNFAAEGDYTVRLIASGGGCADSVSQSLLVRDSDNAEIIGPASSCSNINLTFNAGSTHVIDPYFCYKPYLWYISDSIQPVRTDDPSTSYSFPLRGDYTLKLVAEYDNGCTDTATHDIHINGPSVDFTASASFGCSPFDVEFTDLSSAEEFPIVSHFWDFDDETDTTYTNILGPITHTFVEDDSFVVQLVVTDSIGCQGIQTTTIKSANPDAEFTFSPKVACAGDTIVFEYDTLNNPIDSLVWNLGNGVFLRDAIVPLKYPYSSSAIYKPELTLYRFGCSKTHVPEEDSIVIQNAIASFEVSDTAYTCYPKLISFSHLSDESIDSALSYWDYGIGEGPQPYLSNPQFTYITPGTFYPMLRVETKLGCIDSATQKITITGPTGEFSMSEDKTCLGDSIMFTVTKLENTQGFIWDMGDGNPSGDSIIFHTYPAGGIYYPHLVLFGDSSNCRPYVEDTVWVFDVIADFEVPDSALCLGYSIPFTNTSADITNSIWDFGNGSSSTENNPTQIFNSGNYSVELIAINDSGNCRDTIVKGITINPVPTLTLSDDVVLCENGQVTLTASGGDEIQWYIVPGTILSTSYNYSINADSSNYYKAMVTDNTTMCQSSDSVFVLLQNRPVLNMQPAGDTTIGIGEYITLTADSAASFTYQWTGFDSISCFNCANTTLRPLDDGIIVLTVRDTNGCFTDSSLLIITIDDNYKIRLPSAFTPGLEENNIIYVKGWGIEELLEFRVYNRWGNEVFYTADINEGWDGTYKGKLQNTDTYVYIVRVRLLSGIEVTERGKFNLLR